MSTNKPINTIVPFRSGTGLTGWMLVTRKPNSKYEVNYGEGIFKNRDRARYRRGVGERPVRLTTDPQVVSALEVGYCGRDAQGVYRFSKFRKDLQGRFSNIRKVYLDLTTLD